MKSILIKLLSWLAYKLHYKLVPLNLPYLHDVIYSGDFVNDLSSTLKQFFGASHTYNMSDMTRSKIRLAMAKVREKHIINSKVPDDEYVVSCNSTNNGIDIVADHKLHADFSAPNTSIKFTLEGSAVTI